jgi:hypothetical protein
MGLLGVPSANTAIGVSPETFLLLPLHNPEKQHRDVIGVQTNIVESAASLLAPLEHHPRCIF